MSKRISESVTNAWILLHRTHRFLLESVEKELKEAELPPLDWYDILLELNRANVSGLHQYELCEKVLLSKHNLSRLLDRLEKNRLVKRYNCKEDGRSKIIKITSPGENLLKKVWPVYSKAIEDYFGEKLNEQDLVKLDTILNKVFENPN
jgi:DNA-binding MarR family transcriptional regulator